MMAIRDHALAAEAMGIDIALLKTRTFALSALYTGVAGSLAPSWCSRRARQLRHFRLDLPVCRAGGGRRLSIGGAIFGGLFIEFVPNIAEKVLKAAPGAVTA